LPAALDSMLQLALELLPHSEFGVAQWAERCHLSDRQLRRRVTELTGLSPLIWLREQRLQRIRSLLSDGTCQTLIEAGAQVGLCNPGYLYRLYRARFGE
jgi:AraC-like DNA-binding protein